MLDFIQRTLLEYMHAHSAVHTISKAWPMLLLPDSAIQLPFLTLGSSWISGEWDLSLLPVKILLYYCNVVWKRRSLIKVQNAAGSLDITSMDGGELWDIMSPGPWKNDCNAFANPVSTLQSWWIFGEQIQHSSLQSLHSWWMSVVQTQHSTFLH